MKKFLIGAVLLFLTIMGGVYAVYHRGFYMDIHPDRPIAVWCRTEGKEIQIKKDKEFESFLIKGVDVSSSMPGEYASSFAPSEKDYLRWLKKIAEMGANTVRVYTIMDDEFYNAFYKFNTTGKDRLYLMQGILVSDEANAGAEDAYGDEFFGRLIKDGLDAVDIIHGRKIITTNDMRGTGVYLKDISPWVLGYIVGQEWNTSTVAYTDHREFYDTEYHGDYFETTEDATVFETMLAKVLDRMTSYESKKYKTQRLISFANDPLNDPFAYETGYAKQIGKYSFIDAEHIVPKKEYQGGYFASYRLFDFANEFYKYLSQEQKAEFGEILDEIDTEEMYGGYIPLMSAYHTMPVIAAGYGFSTARGAVTVESEPLTEEEQGEKLMLVYRDMVKNKWSGGFISTWQDTWERRTWNTAFSSVITQNYLWHDLQSDGQNYGIMAYKPGEKENVCTVDGENSEWEKEDKVLEHNGMSLSVKTDEEGIYLLVQGRDLEEKRLYVPIDTTENSGSNQVLGLPVSFQRKADFLLCIDGKENTKLLVQERYDALRENFLFETTGRDPFLHYPDKNSAEFVSIGMALQNQVYVDESLMLTPYEIQQKKALRVWETGKMVHGKGDPEDPEYNSLADFCFGKQCVELCIPWLLLNVGDPSGMEIHRDYYEHYGVSFQKASEFWFGIGEEEMEIPMEKREMEGYETPKWREYLKKSYTVIQNEWKEGAQDEIVSYQ